MAQKQNTGTEAPVVTMDAFSNPAARIGFGTLDLLQATEYPMTRMTQNYQPVPGKLDHPEHYRHDPQ